MQRGGRAVAGARLRERGGERAADAGRTGAGQPGTQQWPQQQQQQGRHSVAPAEWSGGVRRATAHHRLQGVRRLPPPLGRGVGEPVGSAAPDHRQHCLDVTTTPPSPLPHICSPRQSQPPSPFYAQFLPLCKIICVAYLFIQDSKVF